MGRWAYFYKVGDKQSSKDEYEYKFWVAIQDSVIPWADTKLQYYLAYRPEDIKDFSEDVKTYWEKNGDEYHEPENIPKDMHNALEEYFFENYKATDTDEDLDYYWKKTNRLADKLGVARFAKKEDEDIFDTLEAYEEFVWDSCNNKDNKELSAQYADLTLKTVVCVLLETWGAYTCNFDA